MKKYLLSTGRSTDKLEYYIADLFKLYLQVYPDDIPGASGIGFDFIITNTMKSDLPEEVKNRIGNLVSRIKDRFSSLDISVQDIEVIDETKVKFSVLVNSTREEITINLFNDN